MADENVNVLFHVDYTVKNDDADFYKAGEVYEMTPAQAALFNAWCDCESTDRKPTAKPVRTGKSRSSFFPRRRKEEEKQPEPKAADKILLPLPGPKPRNG